MTSKNKVVNGVWFEVKPWCNFSIEEHVVARVTEHFVILPNGRREGLTTDYASWFPSASLAIEFCIEKLTEKSARATAALTEINGRLAELKKISEGK